MAKTIDGKEWVSLSEAAERLGLDYDTIRVRVRQHQIESQFGSDRQRYIPWERISALGRKRQVPGRPPRTIDPTLAQQFAEVKQALLRLEKRVKEHDPAAIREAGTDLLTRANALVNAASAA